MGRQRNAQESYIRTVQILQEGQKIKQEAYLRESKAKLRKKVRKKTSVVNDNSKSKEDSTSINKFMMSKPPTRKDGVKTNKYPCLRKTSIKNVKYSKEESNSFCWEPSEPPSRRKAS